MKHGALVCSLSAVYVDVCSVVSKTHKGQLVGERGFVVSVKDSSQAPFKTEMQSENSGSQRETSLLNMEKKQVTDWIWNSEWLPADVEEWAHYNHPIKGIILVFTDMILEL